MTKNNVGGLCHTTPRLDKILDIIKDARSVADIGCDHAYLSILLAREGKAAKIIGADVSEGPLAKAKANVERFGLSDRIELRLGDGLGAICEGETECIVIAGMGANVIAKILTDGENVARKAQYIVLQSMTGSEDLRQFLYENGYEIINETLVREDRRIYAIMVVKSGKKMPYTMLDCYISPALRQSGDALLGDYYAKQKNRIVRAYEGMKNAKRCDVDTQTYKKLIDEFEAYERTEGR